MNNGQSLIAFLADRGPEIWAKLLEHLVWLTCIPMGCAILVGIPLGIWITRHRRLQGPVLGTVGVIQTIPSLAMLAFLLAVFGQIGKQPAIVALTLYALLPIVRNTLTGLEGVPSEILEAADGLGFSGRQRLCWVELGLAMPVIVAGIRTAAVICVGVATLSTFIGAGGLGDFINRGLALSNIRLIVLGAVTAAVLALVLDFGLGLLEAWLRPGRKQGGLKWKTSVFAVVVGGLVAGGLALAGKAPVSPEQSAPTGTIAIASKNFTEQFILAEMMAQLIERHTTLEVERVFNLGGTIICHQALVNGAVDIYPEYTGTGLTAILDRTVPEKTDRIMRMVRRAYRKQFNCEWLEPFGFNNTYALTVTREAAEAHGWKSISDLASSAGDLNAAFTSEFLERPDGYPGLREAYDLEFAHVRDIGPELMYEAVARGEVDVICAFATDGRIPAYALQVLADDRHFFPPYHAAPVVRQETLLAFPRLRDVVGRLAGELDDETMQQLNYEVDEKKRAPANVAREWLLDRDLL